MNQGSERDDPQAQSVGSNEEEEDAERWIERGGGGCGVGG